MPEEPVFFKGRAQWRRWLEKNHETATEIWVLAYKVHTGKKSVSYLDALEEAICFGWIDSRMRRIDDEKHAWRFAPRKPNSIWSLSNRKRAERLMMEGKMKPRGLTAVTAGKKSGQWDRAVAPSKPPTMPRDLKQALIKNEEAWKNFREFAKSYRTTYIYWVLSAKRDETRKKRIAVVVERAAKNLKMYMA